LGGVTEDANLRAGLARLEAVVEGRVQGVGYRVFVLRRARDLGLVGWVANEPDGTVRCLAEGPRAALDELPAALREGPRGAGVRGLHETWASFTGGFSRFEVRSGWHPGD
jgi:acylphosphatase